MTRYAYLHGFASGPLSRKGVHLERAFAERGVTLDRPDLNRPSFARLSHDAALAAIDDLAGSETWRFVGSSMGGWLAARWAELHPARVDRLVLLCPGFDLGSRWPVLFGAENMARWERDGELALPDGAGVLTPVHYGFFEEAQRQPSSPAVPCPTLILHGTADEVVPIEGSRAYAAERPHVRLLEIPGGDHALTDHLDRVADEVMGFLF